MDHFIEVKEVYLESGDRIQSESYPESGLYISRSEKASDFVFVNKNIGNVLFICPEIEYDRIDLVARINLDEPYQNQPESATPSGFVSEEFVMNFTKLLTGKK